MVEEKESTKIEVNGDNGEDIAGEETDAAPAEESDAPPSDPLEDLEEKYEAAVEEQKQTFDRFLRVSAEFENYKKRKDRELADFRKFANESLFKDLLPLVDNLDRAVESAKQDQSSSSNFVDGVEMILNETLKVLDKYKVSPIDALNKPFDPSYHQAVYREESDQHPDNTVINVIQKGYMLHDRLLRPAMVVVSQAKKSAEGGEN